jgi:hypothetical protein
MWRKDRTLIIGGFPGYGIVGGGLAFYDLDTGESTLVPNQALVRGQSTITMRILPGGDIIAGTSIAAPGGAQPIAEEAILYILDGSSREVTFQTHPVEGAAEIPALELGPNGQVFGLTGGGRLFTFNPETRDLSQSVDLSEYGSDVGTDQSLRTTETGELLALMTDGIVTLDPETLQITQVAEPPTEITTGTGLIAGDLYFSSGVNVWRYDLDGCGK